MEALVGAESLLLALLAVLVVGLLRSHAEILRRLDGLSGGADLPEPRERSPHLGEAREVGGATPSGGARQIALGGGAPNTLLAFLSSGCSTCAELIDALVDSPPPLPDGVRLVVVTKDRAVERVRRFRAVEQRAEVVMSSAAWDDYAVPGSPYFVYVDGGRGRIAGEGSATTWPQVVSLLVDAIDDAADRDGRDAPRIDAALRGAGITPGHPSLRPGRRPPPPAG